MAFAPRSRATIRASLLAALTSRYADRGEQLLTVDGSDADFLASALAVELEGLEAQAAAVTLDILPDTATTAALERHGGVEGLTREPAVAALVRITLTGLALSTTTSVAGKSLQATTGLAYVPSETSGGAPAASLTTDGAGAVTFYAKCTTTGVAGNLAVDAVLTWSSAPAGYPSTAAVDELTVVGTDAETDTAYAARILARRQSRPASGNAADWREWCKSCAGVEDAFVYPVMAPDGTVDTPGCVTVVCVGAAQGDSIINTRMLGAASGDPLPLVKGYVEGTNDAAGTAVTNGLQLRPVVISTDDITIQVPVTTTQNIDASVTVNTANAFSFASPARLARASGTSTTVVQAGDYSALGGKSMLVYVGTGVVRGGFVNVTPTNVAYSAPNTTFTFNASDLLSTAPSNDSAGYCIYPAPANWAALRTAAFAYFDALGPGNAAAPSARFPDEDTVARATLYKSALAGAIVTVAGVLNATLNTPLFDVVPAAKTLVLLGDLIVRQ